MYKKHFFTFLLLITSYSSFADVIDATGIRWPIPVWNIIGHQNERMQTPTCENFINYTTKSKDFLTDGLVVIKDGSLQYEFYDKKYNPSTPHVLWSISKTITATLLGIAVKEGRVSLDDYLHQYLPRPEASSNYQKIKLSNLLYLDTGYIWNEYYSGDVTKSPVLNMLYGNAHQDMLNFALSRDIITEGPGYKWNYTTGTPVITMGVLKEAYGDDYELMPWKNLFDPLSMADVHFEHDARGVFNGGSSAFASPREMAKLGYLYLNHGIWNGREILTDDWVKTTLKVSPGYLSPGTVIKDITDDGVYGGSFWLNKAVKAGFGKPYPASPDDMFMGLGHFGQFIVVLPSQNMVIARTGHDNEYNSKIDVFVTKALACFHDPEYPQGKIIPPPASTKSKIKELFITLKTSLHTNLIQATVAKTICSCHFISGIEPSKCVADSNIPLAKWLTKYRIEGKKVYAWQSLLAKTIDKVINFQGKPVAVAEYNSERPEFGCQLK